MQHTGLYSAYRNREKNKIALALFGKFSEGHGAGW